MNDPALYPPQHPYGYGHPMAQGHIMPPGQPLNYPPATLPPNVAPNNFQRTSHPNVQQPIHPNPGFVQHAQRNGNITRTESRGHMNVGPGPALQSPIRNLQSAQFSDNQVAPRTPAVPGTPVQNLFTQISGPQTPSHNTMAQNQAPSNANVSQQAQMQATGQATRNGSQSGLSATPQSPTRERARISVLLEINTHLLQELVSLQANGRGGVGPHPAQQSPSSPTSTDPSNPLGHSPVDPSKAGSNKAASQEYTDCMRRLQANLSYLAAIADAKKKVNGALPPAPAILIPPPHLKEVQELYKKLNSLFPEASQSTINKAMAFASAQSAKMAT